MQSCRRHILALAAVGAAVAAPALAADMPPLYDSVPMVPVEVGSSWYLRGDVSYDFKSDLDARFDARFIDATGAGIAETGDLGGFKLDDNANFSLGFGYQFTDFLRGDLTAHYWKTNLKYDAFDVYSGFCGFAGASEGGCRSGDYPDAQTWEVMANGYIDLGTFAGFTPYVGGGVGAAHVKYDDINVLGACADGSFDCPNPDRLDLDGGKDWRFAYALTAGAAYDLTRDLKLDVGYRYLNVDNGEIFEVGAGSDVGLKVKDGGFDRHTIQAGLRYSLF